MSVCLLRIPVYRPVANLQPVYCLFFFSAMGLKDDSGNIYEMLEYTFFDHTDMGTWDTMIDGMVNVSSFQIYPALTNRGL